MSAAEREPRQGGDVSHADPIAELRPSLADTADAAGADETGITVRIHPDDAAASDLENSRSVVVHEENVYAASAHTDTPIAPSPSVVGSSSSTLPAAPSSSSATATEPSWLASLRADWDTDAIELASQKRVREARNRPAGGRVLLSPAVEAMPPLQGDVVWKREPYRRITVDQYETYLEASKLKQYRFHRMIRQITSMFKPVVLLCVLIFIYSQLVVKNEKNPKYAWKMLVYKQQPEDSTAHKFTGSLSNALTVLSAILLITFTFIFLYWMEWKLALRRFLIAVITVLLLPWIYFGLQVIEYYDARVDSISYALACLQFLACGYFALVVKAETPANINRFYLVALAVSVAWPFMEFTEWTVWTTIIVLTLYDLLAVLAPCGPLRWIMDAESRSKSLPPSSSASPLPGLMYHGEFFMLGLGDLVFYGALMGRAANAGAVPLVAATLGVLMGVAGTILWSYHTTAHAIPALPLSVLFGLLAYTTTVLTVLPMLEHMAVGTWNM